MENGNRARDNVERVDGGGAGAFHAADDVAALDLKRDNEPSAPIRRAGRECDARCVDEPSAAAGQSVLVGDDDIGSPAIHLNGPLQHRAVRAGHLVENGRGRTSGSEVAVTRDQAAEQRLQEFLVGVVEDRVGCDSPKPCRRPKSAP